MSEADPVARVRHALAACGREAQVRLFAEHLPTAPVAAQAMGVELGRIAKSIVLWSGEQPVLVLAAGDRRVNRQRVREVLGGPKVRIASAEDVLAITGYVAGGVSPVGWLQHPTVLLDRSLERFADVWAGGGIPEALLRLRVADLPLLTDGRFAEVCEELPAP